ncbi:MAG: hypothetical protein RLZZ630_1291 [Bacteroidota bacterium]|jgi:hypothetical protein
MKHFLFILLFLAAAADSRGNTKYLVVPVEFVVINGEVGGALVYVRRSDATVATFRGERNMELRLDYNAEYQIDFTKPGYITKSIKVNTQVPSKRLADGFEPYKIGIRLFKQYAGVNIVIFNQPVALIRYLPDIDDVGYDTDYTKAVLSEIKRAEEELNFKAMEERGLPSNVATSGLDNQPQKVRAGKTKIGDLMPLESNSGSSNAFKTFNASGGDYPFDSRPAIRNIHPQSDGDAPDELKSENDIDAPVGAISRAGSKDIRPVAAPVERVLPYKNVETVHETNRVITITRIIKGQQVLEFREVKYDWGGVFYFRNKDVPVTQHLYDYLIEQEMK